MEYLRASLKEGDQVLFENLEVNLFVRESASGLKEWYGSFELPASGYIQPGGPYKLILEDGRSGDILMSDILISSDLPTLVHFLGSGPLE
jgi:hypothetical protein